MRILVTGGAGFIGSNLVHHLLGVGGEAPEVAADRVVNLEEARFHAGIHCGTGSTERPHTE